MARKFLTYILVPVICLTLLTGYEIKTHAKDSCAGISDEGSRLECYEKLEAETRAKLDSTRSKISSTQNTVSQLSGQLSVTQKELDDVQKSINEILAEINNIDVNLKDRYDKLANKINLRNKIIRSYSKKTSLSDLNIWLSGGFSSEAFMLAFNKAANTETLKIIGLLNSEIKGFEKDKADNEVAKTDLQKTQTQLASLKNDLANKKTSAENQVGQLEEQSSEYEKTLEGLQDKILSLKSSDENGSVGDYAPPSAKTPDPPFSGRAFAAFSYGAYTHYNGMSQYGAEGRADAGQGYEAILKFYYKVGLSDASAKDNKAKISVQGYGEMTYQKYLYGIAEMPSDWNINALKAQAIAARTYAYRSNKPICTSQSCQVFLKSKSDNPPAKWKQAVDETSGKILKDPKTSQYSSTTGGYINNVGWDAKGDWPGDAYEKKAGSPWFYKAWYTKSYNDTSSCGHAHPWLTEEEMADILNSYVVWSKGSSKDKSHITPVTKSCWGGDPYTLDKMAETADKYGDSYSSVSSVKVTISNAGYTSEVRFETDRGSVSINGADFKTVYNLRAPGYISIKSRLFDLEKRN
jgi:peptidoglycan hydrolase-like amidase/peptidoglycan hydrolase CwlO-like protein